MTAVRVLAFPRRSATTLSGFCALAAVLALVPGVAQAQRDRYAPTVLQVAPTPRAATLASTAAARDIEAIFGNPAMVGVAAGT